MLSKDNTFPFSEKDIELVCGSLVTTRNNTLQVTHLTVKEFVTGHSDPALSVLPKSGANANLQLLLVCFKYLEIECSRPFADLPPKAKRIGKPDDRPDASQLRMRLPFLEYASSAWLGHLFECSQSDASRILRDFRKTFDSCTTFVWMEAFLTLGTMQIYPLPLELEGVRDWVGECDFEEIPSSELDARFDENWSSAVEQILREYRDPLQGYPPEVYYLDFASIFEEFGLVQMYISYGDAGVRAEPSQIFADVDQNRKTDVPPNRRLRMQDDNYQLGLFIFDSKRNIYIWSRRLLNDGHQRLYIQSAEDGKQRAPVKDSEHWHELAHFGSHATSRCGRHIATVYQKINLNSLLISVWTIEEKPSFHHRWLSTPWAAITFRHIVEDCPFLFWVFSERPVAFTDENHCCTPDGLIRIDPTGQSSIQRIELKGYFPPTGSGNDDHIRGGAVFSADGTSVCFWLEDSVKILAYPSLEVVRVMSGLRLGSWVSVSPSNRYLVTQLSAIEPVLIDTIYRITTCIPLGHGIDWQTKVFFSDNEHEIYVYSKYPGTFYLFGGLPSQAYLRECQEIPDPYQEKLLLDQENKRFLSVTLEGEIQRIMLEPKIELLDAPNREYEPYEKRSFVSQDGTLVAILSFNSKRVQLRIHRIDHPSLAPRIIELLVPTRVCGIGLKYLTISPSFSVLVLDTMIYRLALQENDIIADLCGSVELPTALLKTDHLYTYVGYLCSVHKNDGLVLYCDDSYGRSGGIAVFRIEPGTWKIDPIQLSLPQSLRIFSAYFHPFSPELTLAYLQKDAAGVSSFHIALINFSTGVVAAVINIDGKAFSRSVTYRKPLLYHSCDADLLCRSSGRLSMLRFSELMISIDGSRLFFYQGNQLFLGTELGPQAGAPKATQRPVGVRRYLAIGDSFYILGGRDFEGLTLCRSGPLANRKLEQRRARPRGSVSLPNLVAVSASSYGSRHSYLLLGETDDVKLRSLIVPRDDQPPEIKTLAISWAEARDMLDRKWEEKYGGEETNSEEGYGGEETNSEEEYSWEETDSEEEYSGEETDSEEEYSGEGFNNDDRDGGLTE